MAAEALGEIADPRAEAALLGALSDASPEVQFFAAFALSAAGTRRSMPALAALAATRGTKTRFGTTAREARRALATIERRKTS